MPSANARLRGPGLLALLGGMSLLATTLPAACNHGGGVARSDAGVTGGAHGGTAMDAAATGGPGGATGGTGEGGRAVSTGGASGGGGAAGGNMNDGGPPDLAPSDGGIAQGGAGGSPSTGSSGGGGAMMDGGSADAMFPCGPCSPHWVCGGDGDATQINITLTPEEDGCYLEGLSGHVLLGPDGTLTENGAPIGRAQKFGPQVAFYRADGSQWLYCGGNLPCSP